MVVVVVKPYVNRIRQRWHPMSPPATSSQLRAGFIQTVIQTGVVRVCGWTVEPESTSGQKLKNMRDQGRGHARNAPATRHPSESSFSSTPPSSHLLPLCWGGTPFVRIYLLTTPPDVMKSWSPWTGRLCRRVHAGRYCTPSSLNTCTGM